MTLVDTSSWIQYLRRDGEAEMKEKVRSLLLDGAAVLCPVIIAELWMGAGSTDHQVASAFNFHNTSQVDLQPNVSSPSSLLRRIRLLLGGVEIYDCSYAGRVHETMWALLLSARLANDACEGWGTSGISATLEIPFTPAPIPVGKSRRMMCQLMCNFLSQGKCILLLLIGSLVLELELGDSDDCFSI